MKNKLFAGLTMLGLTAILVTSCTKFPQAEMDATTAAVEEAKTAGADLYVPESFASLQDSLNGVWVNIEDQKSKFIKNYSSAVEQLAGVTQFAQKVKQQTELRIEELKVEIQNTITEVNSLIETNKQLILQAPKGKEGTTALVAIKGELSIIESTISEAGSMFEAGEYLPSLNKVKAAREKASSINVELTEVIAKYKANAKKR